MVRATADKPFLFVTLALVALGLFALASASTGLSQAKFGTPYEILIDQLEGVVVGLVLMLILSRIRYRTWKKFALPIFILGLLILLVVFIPSFGKSYAKGASRWISVGVLSFQPAEFTKVATIIYLAAILDSHTRRKKTNDQRIIPFVIATGVVGLFLLQQPNISALIIILASAAIMYFTSGGRTTHILGTIVLATVVIGSFMYVSGYNMSRITAFVNPGTDALGKNYQQNQSLIAIGSGGIFGKGIGESTQKRSRLPEPIGDAIFAVYAEELGYVGSLALLALYVFFFIRGIMIAARAPDQFASLLVIGIVMLIVVQMAVNVSAFTKLIPATGTPLPFVSFGRSSMVSFLAAVGIVLNISRYSRI